jgi:protein ImuB
MEGAPAREREIRAARPTADARVLAELCERALEEMSGADGLDAPISGLRIEATEAGPSLADQLDVFRPAAPDPSAVESALAPLLARWGEGALNRAVLRGAHLPIAHAVWEPCGGAAVRELSDRHRSGVERGEPASPADAHLSLCLRRFPEPAPARVTVDAAGRPTRLAADRAAPAPSGSPLPPLPDNRAIRAEGPERLSGAWWADGYAREYWLVEAADSLWLLFLDARDGRWWVEGWWD